VDEPQPALRACWIWAPALLNRFAIYFSTALIRNVSLTVINRCHRFSLPSGKEEKDVEAKIQAFKMVSTDYMWGINHQSAGGWSAAAGMGRLE
jgi:hypothetical protein